MLTRVVSSPEELPLGAASTMGIAREKWWVCGIYQGKMADLYGFIGFTLEQWWVWLGLWDLA
jgi:hypothetical protein